MPTNRKPETAEEHVARVKLTALASEYKAMRHDPLMLQTVMLLRASGKAPSYIQRTTGISSSTIKNWEKKKTRRPQAATLRFALRAVGYKLAVVKE